MSIKNRGFASLSKAKKREIASKGGKAAHAKGVAHKFTQEEAKEAGRKGGIAAYEKRRNAKTTQEQVEVEQGEPQKAEA